MLDSGSSSGGAAGASAAARRAHSVDRPEESCRGRRGEGARLGRVGFGGGAGRRRRRLELGLVGAGAWEGWRGGGSARGGGGRADAAAGLLRPPTLPCMGGLTSHPPTSASRYWSTHALLRRDDAMPAGAAPWRVPEARGGGRAGSVAGREASRARLISCERLGPRRGHCRARQLTAGWGELAENPPKRPHIGARAAHPRPRVRAGARQHDGAALPARARAPGRTRDGPTGIKGRRRGGMRSRSSALRWPAAGGGGAFSVRGAVRVWSSNVVGVGWGSAAWHM